MALRCFPLTTLNLEQLLRAKDFLRYKVFYMHHDNNLGAISPQCLTVCCNADNNTTQALGTCIVAYAITHFQRKLTGMSTMSTSIMFPQHKTCFRSLGNRHLFPPIISQKEDIVHTLSHEAQIRASHMTETPLK